jgi:hypothetical protein
LGLGVHSAAQRTPKYKKYFRDRFHTEFGGLAALISRAAHYVHATTLYSLLLATAEGFLFHCGTAQKADATCLLSYKTTATKMSFLSSFPRWHYGGSLGFCVSK